MDSSNKSKPKRVTLTIPVKVTCIDFYKDSSTVCVHGRNMVRTTSTLSSAHSTTLERNKGFEIFKKIWDSTTVAALFEAFKKSSGTGLAVVLIQESHAEVYLVGNGLIKLCSKIEASQTRKKSACLMRL